MKKSGKTLTQQQIESVVAEMMALAIEKIICGEYRMVDCYDGISLSGYDGTYGFRMTVMDYIQIEIGRGRKPGENGEFFPYKTRKLASCRYHRLTSTFGMKQGKYQLLVGYFRDILLACHMAGLNPR